MKKSLIIVMILTLSLLFTACGSNTDGSQGSDEVATNEKTNEEEIEEEKEEKAEEEEIEEVEINIVEGGIYTDNATGAITIDVPDGYVPNEDMAYSSEETLATLTVKPQDSEAELLNTFLMVQIITAEDADASARAYLQTYAENDEEIIDVEVAGLRGYRFGTDEMTGWLNEYYTLIGPRTVDGGYNYIVIIWGLGLDASYVEDVHGMITSLEFDFTQL